MVTPEAPKKSRRVSQARGQRSLSSPLLGTDEGENGKEVDYSRYFVERQSIGQGSQGTVFKVKNISDSRWYALKVLKATLTGDSHRSRLIDEINYVKSFSPHPHILSYIEAWESDGEVNIQMDLCTKSLEEHMSEWQQQTSDRMEEACLWNYAADLALGLHQIHRKGFVHRDIKPANVFFDPEGHLRIGDFGLLVPEEKRDSREGDSRYLAREVIKEDHCGKPADLFSLGASLFELSSLVQMPSDGHLWEVLRDGSVHEIEEFPKLFSDEYTRLVSDLMHPDPLQRPTIQQVLAHPRIVDVISSRRETHLQSYMTAIQDQVPSMKQVTPSRSRMRTRSMNRSHISTVSSSSPSSSPCRVTRRSLF